MGRGSSGAGGGSLPKGGGGVNPDNIKNIRDLISMREGKREEVDSVLEAARSLMEEYGVDAGNFVVADVGGKDSATMAFSDGEIMGFNSKYFDGVNMEKAYDACVAQGFHPSRGNKSAMEAVGDHEGGHIATMRAAAKLGYTGPNSMDRAAETIVNRAMPKVGSKSSMKMATKISGYAKTSYAECVAEAVADVSCNGSRASAESRAIVEVLKGILK